MSDIHCPVCGEPWDAYGVRHGDMLPWEADLFRKGAGCPCCKGEAPAQANAETLLERHARDVVLGGATDTPEEFAVYDATMGGDLEMPPRPKWERPEDKVVWECANDSCDCAVMHDADVKEPREEQYELRSGSYVNGVYWRGKCYTELRNNGDEWHDLLLMTVRDGMVAPEDRKVDGKVYCPRCAETCGDCGDLFLSEDLHLHDGDYQNSFCEECLMKREHDDELSSIESNAPRDNAFDLPDDWVSTVHHWLCNNKSEALDGHYVSDDDVMEALEALGWYTSAYDDETEADNASETGDT